ncbi:MAG TPA: MdtA/MuxA family multidrug efflux RND transporter periplasmic adaptor subunit [Stellaceae bacterium]|nr:MdtA/MuxA family multidrug efflux RND transporter periplasmic adaptor subunit [Stellaceae bacterium]
MDDQKLIEDLRPDAPLLGAPTRRGSRWRAAAWIAAALLIAAGIAWWIHSRPGTQTAMPRFATSGPMPVLADTAQKGAIDITLDELGTVTPLATVTIRTQISGQLMKLNFQEGQMVAKGDLVAEIDSRPYDLALGQMQGQLARDQALLKNAELDLARYRKLVAQDSIPHQQLDTQDALVHQLQGTVMTDQAQVDNAKLNVLYCHITAPVSGRVGLRQVDVGNYVQTNDTNGIVVITQIQPITVIFTVPEDEVPAIMRRLRAGATLPVDAYDRSRTTKLATGQLSTVDNQVDTSTGTVKLRAQFDNAGFELFPNQFVNVHLTVDTLNDTTIVASSAVQRGAAGSYVYLINPDDTVTVRPVKLGPTNGERVAVASGLAPGDQVVVDGADKLRDGAKISRRDTAGAAAPANPAQPAAPRRRDGAQGQKTP